MSPFGPEENSFEPALLLALTVMVGVALGRDVFYDVVTQAVAMTALALLVAALVLPVLGLARLLGARPVVTHRTIEPLEEGVPIAPDLESEAGTEDEILLSAREIVAEREPEEPAAPPSLERNAGSVGVKVRAGMASHNDNLGWAGSRLTHSGLR